MRKRPLGADPPIDFFILLDPAPLTGNPNGTGTVTLQQVAAQVTGRFDVTITSAGQTSTSTGSMSGTVGAHDGIDDLTVVVDQLSSSCTPKQFTAHGNASLQNDGGTMRFTWSAMGASTCGGTSTEVSLTAVPGMRKQ